MKKTTLILAALIGHVVSGYGADIVITNDVEGPVNTGSTDLYAVTTGNVNCYVTNSSITAKNGQTLSPTLVSANQYALGTGGITSLGTGQALNIVGSTVAGSKGGTITAPDILSNNRTHTVTGGNGIYASGAILDVADTFISGGDGGVIDVQGANNASSANGGYGLRLNGVSSMTASNVQINGGSGGLVQNTGRNGIANGGAGIYITGSGSSVDLNLTDTTVTGGDGGEVVYGTTSGAAGGAGLLITSGAQVTISGGTFIGGKAGLADESASVQASGAGLEIQGSTVTLADGAFVGGILLSSGTSTLSLQNTYTNDAAFTQTGGTVTFDEWYDGQLQDVTVSAGTMKFNFDGTNAFSIDGMFTIANSSPTGAKAEFNSGLVVKSGGVLDLGQSTVIASDATTEMGGTVLSTLKNAAMGKIQVSGDLTLESGTKWIITDIGTTTVNVGKEFVLASAASGTNIINDLDYTDVQYVGSNGAAGWLGSITNVYVDGSSVKAVYGQEGIDEVLGLVGDTSAFGLAMADLTSLVTPTNTTAYNNLVGLTPIVDEARVLMTNGYIRTPEVARVIIGLQSVFADQIKDRTRSHLNQMEVGYPAASSPVGAGGWDWLRNLSDRWESEINTDGMRKISDRAEDNLGYDQVKRAMDAVTPDLEPGTIGLPREWQVWGRGYGSRVQQDTRDGFAGYDADIGGGILGIDKRMNNVLLGVGGGYNLTDMTGYSGLNARINTGHAVGYLSAHGDHLFFDANLDGAVSRVETEYEELGMCASYDAASAGLYLGGGYAMALTDDLMFTPDASLLTTYYTHESYSETSSLELPTKKYDSYDQTSSLSTLGATIALIHKVDLTRSEMAVQPEIRAHWLHNFNAELNDESYIMNGGVNTIDTPLMATEEDLYKIGAGVRVSQWSSDSTEIGVDVDYTFGGDYESYIISGKLMHRF